MAESLQILVVCTANICRSPAAAAVLSYEMGRRFGAEVSVWSAGTEALAGSSACELSGALVGTYPQRIAEEGDHILEYSEHASRVVSPADLRRSDLVLTMDRSHRSRLAQLLPAARSHTFTLRQAAGIAGAVAAHVADGELPAGAPPLPPGRTDRLRWLIAELDAARGLTPVRPGNNPPQQDEGLHWHPDDVPDPHVVGYQIHPMTVELIEQCVRDLTAAVDTIRAAPITTPAPTSA